MRGEEDGEDDTTLYCGELYLLTERGVREGS